MKQNLPKKKQISKEKIFSYKAYMLYRIFKEIKVFLNDDMATVRSTASIVGCSKSTVYIDLTDRLPKILYEMSDSQRLHIMSEIKMDDFEPELICDKVMYHVVIQMQRNKRERAKRGGESTRNRYKNMKK